MGKTETITEYWDKDKTIIMWEYPFVNGFVHGVVRKWYTNGVLRIESNHNMGMDRGITKEWDLDGELCFIGTYKEFRNGVTVMFRYGNEK